VPSARQVRRGFTRLAIVAAVLLGVPACLSLAVMLYGLATSGKGTHFSDAGELFFGLSAIAVVLMGIIWLLGWAISGFFD
jgi:low affinity Fe/Cu permease